MRPHHPWYRAATNSWYVEVGGEQHLLGKHPSHLPPPRKRKRGDSAPKPPNEIEQACHRLMAADPANIPKAADLRGAVVCDLFLEFSKNHHTEDTYRSYQEYLQDFCELDGTLLAKDLKPLHVTRWLDSHPGWNGSRRNAVVSIKRAFNSADAEGLLQPNPIKYVKKPPQPHRDLILTLEERQEIIEAIPDQSFRDFLFALQETGARGKSGEEASEGPNR